MTFLDKLADLLTGGELSRLREGKAYWIAATNGLEADLRTSYSNELRLRAVKSEQWNALSRIAALETKHANATVRKMARIAKEAME